MALTSIKSTVGSLKANASLTTAQYTIVKLHTVSGEVVAAGAGDLGIGVLLNKPAAGAAAEIALINSGGICTLKVDGSGTAIAVGDTLKSDASGRGVKGVADRDKIIGIALEASSAANDLIDVLLVSAFERSTA